MSKSHFKSIVVFGDGLSDMGSWGKLTDYRYPPAAHGFFGSRWTNGKVWIERVADSLGIELGFDRNFAMGGATTGFRNINEPLKPLLKLDSGFPLHGMLGQVVHYLEINEMADDSTLYVLWAGGHDVGGFLQFGQPDLLQTPPAGNYSTAVEILFNAGARHFLVGNMPDMGVAPEYFNTPKQAIATRLCKDMNDGLARLTSAYRDQEVDFKLIDAASLFAKVRHNPADYGLKYLEPYLPFEVIDFSNPLNLCRVVVANAEKELNPDEFMNWWAVSVSAAMHQVLANEVMELIKNK